MNPMAQKKSMLSSKDIKEDGKKKMLPTFMTKPREEVKEAMKNMQAKWKKC